MGWWRGPRAGVALTRPAIDCALEVAPPAPRLAKRVFDRLRDMFQPMMEKPVPQPNDPAETSRGFVDGNHRHRLPSASGSRSEEHTSELQSLMRSSYAVFCLNKKKTQRK